MTKKINEIWLDFRFWLLRNIAGKAGVVLNIRFEGGSVKLPEGPGFINLCQFVGCEVAIKRIRSDLPNKESQKQTNLGSEMG